MTVEKIKINLDILLPDVPDEKDARVHRMINELSARKGIDKIHIVPAEGQSKAQLCFHYDPQVISVDAVQKMAEQSGATITRRYQHLVVEVQGIRHQRQIRLIEAVLKDESGILSVAAVATGVVVVEYDKQTISEEQIDSLLKKQGLKIVSGKEIPGIVKITDRKTAAPHKHDHKESKAHDHDHAHGGIWGKNTELIFSIVCGILLGAGFAASKIPSLPDTVSLILYIGAYFFGGYYTAKEAVQTIAKGGFEIDSLMLVAAIGAAILGNWAEGALLLFLFSLGHALEHFAMEKARKSIAALTELAPKTALLRKGGQTTEVKIDTLKKGDIILVKSNTKIAADGIVVKGSSAVNQAPITGESIPVDKEAVGNDNVDIENPDKLGAKHRVFAGTINGNEVLPDYFSFRSNQSL
jgi:Cd2+/Zn2+-exporting ATPase